MTYVKSYKEAVRAGERVDRRESGAASGRGTRQASEHPYNGFRASPSAWIGKRAYSRQNKLIIISLHSMYILDRERMLPYTAHDIAWICSSKFMLRIGTVFIFSMCLTVQRSIKAPRGPRAFVRGHILVEYGVQKCACVC